MENRNNLILKQIANYLMINAFFVDNLGLYHGKIGIVLFFMHYAKYANNYLYEEFAGKLLEDVYTKIHNRLPIDFENGYSGIGWAILYLLKNQFVVGEPKDILTDLDREVVKCNLKYLTDNSFETGADGVSYYINCRLKYSYDMSLFKESYIQDIVDSNIGDIDSFILRIMDDEGLKYDDVLKLGFGLKNGCSGVGLKIMLS